MISVEYDTQQHILLKNALQSCGNEHGRVEATGSLILSDQKPMRSQGACAE